MNFKIIVFSFFTLTLFSHLAKAQWLCREASSIRNESTITACGVGKSNNLEEARVKSRENAIEEFKRLCNMSTDCSDYDYTVTPKRTECVSAEAQHICYRALDFEIGSKKRKSISLDLPALELELKEKNDEITLIQSKIDKINQLQQSKDDLEQKNKELIALESTLNEKETEILKLEDLSSKDTIEKGGYQYLHQLFKNSIKVSLHYWASKFTTESESDILWILAYENRPFKWLGLQLYGGFGRGHLDNQIQSDIDVPIYGDRSTTKVFNGPVSYGDIGLAALVYFGYKGIYFKTDVGLIGGRKVNYEVNYNGAGVGTYSKNENSISGNYFGGHVGFDTRDDKKGWGIYFELGARKLNQVNNLGFMSGLGLNYGY